MTWVEFLDLSVRYGPVAVCAVFALWASATGRFRWQREVNQAEQAQQAATAEWKQRETDLKAQHAQRLGEERADCERQLKELREDRDYWRATSIEHFQRYKDEVAVSESAVRTATRAISRRTKP